MTGLRTVLLVASLVVPLAFVGACLVQGLRERALALQWLAPCLVLWLDCLVYLASR